MRLPLFNIYLYYVIKEKVSFVSHTKTRFEVVSYSYYYTRQHNIVYQFFVSYPVTKSICCRKFTNVVKERNSGAPRTTRCYSVLRSSTCKQVVSIYSALVRTRPTPPRPGRGPSHPGAGRRRPSARMAPNAPCPWTWSTPPSRPAT